MKKYDIRTFIDSFSKAKNTVFVKQ